MFTATQIADAVTATRGECANLFLLAQEHLDVADRRTFAAVVRAADDKTAFAEAAQYALDHHFEQQLVNELILSRSEGGTLLQARMSGAPAGSPLQAISNTAQGFLNPLVAGFGLIKASQCTAHVKIDGQSTGTGVLIEPHLVLTAWHVVRELFNPLAGGGWKPKAAQSQRLRIEFDEVADGLTQMVPSPKAFAADDPWYLTFGPCHDDELEDKIPPNPLDLKGRWDFAVIRLKEAFGKDRHCARLDGRIPVPRNGDKIYVFQHPAGAVQRFHDHVVHQPDPALPGVIPELRFLHTANAAPGSSGGPCFNKDFHLCGMHQGAWSTAPGKVINRGIPASCIHHAIQEMVQRLPPVNPIWRLADRGKTAVIGCDHFQSALWAMSEVEDVSAADRVIGKRILHISGDNGTGKTLRVRVAEHLLAEAKHLKVVIETPSVAPLNAEVFARELCRLAGAEPPTVIPPNEMLSTLAVWRKDVLVPAVVEALNKARRDPLPRTTEAAPAVDGQERVKNVAREDRLVWLIFQDLNKSAAFGEGTSDLMYLLYQQVLTNSWLRVILDGMQGNMAQDLVEAVDFQPVDMDVTANRKQYPITRANLSDFFARQLDELRLDPTALDLPARVAALHQEYVRKYDDATQRGDAARELAKGVRLVIKEYLDQDGF